MTWRDLARLLPTGCLVLLFVGPAVAAADEDEPPTDSPNAQPEFEEEAGESSIRYFALDAPAGMSQAVVVQGHALVHTRQLLPLDREGNVVGEDSPDEQVQQVLDNLDAVLEGAGSSLKQLVRLNVYALAPPTVDRVREQLAERLQPDVRPAITSVLTPMPHRDVVVGLDAVAVGTDRGEEVAFERCEAVAGSEDCADAAVLPRGGVAYLSGIPATGGLTESAVARSISGLWKMLDDLELSPAHVVQLKVFLRPASSADLVRRELTKYFPDQLTPPIVFVEWLAPPPVEIELVAQLPSRDALAPPVQHYNPPEVRPMQIFSRAALVPGDRQIYVSSLYARQWGRGQEQALDVFDQLETILDQAGSDLRHMAKATYYVCDDESARGMDRARLWRYDQDRPPAASKCMVHGVGQAGRTLTMDIIAVSSEQ